MGLLVNPWIKPSDVGMPSSSDPVGGQLRMDLVAGAAANTNIAIAAMKPEDKIWKVIEFVTAAAIATMADRTSTVTVIGNGVFQMSVVTTSNQLMVIWLDVNA